MAMKAVLVVPLAFLALSQAAGGTWTEPSPDSVPGRRLLADYVKTFNARDDECHTNAIPNTAAEKFLGENIPLFSCPDKDIERTYYFRWWTFRKHLRHDLGVWTVSEFLPNVGWAGAGNTIVCAAGHHLREGRWLRDQKYMDDYARFWLADKRASHRRGYSSWLFTGTRLVTSVTGNGRLARDLLDAAVRNFENWERGDKRRIWGEGGKLGQMGGDGKGGFLSIDNYEGTEMSLAPYGYKPLLNSAMWSEAHSIAEEARSQGRVALARRFDAKADRIAEVLRTKCWNPELGFVTTATADGKPGTVRELHGYAPWYFGVPMDKCRPDWSQLTDRRGFLGECGLSFPERRAKGFKVAYEGHECQWNGPSWPFATSIALTAFMNDLKAYDPRFVFLLHQYAVQHQRMLADGTIVPWIDENHHPDTKDWISRTLLFKRRQTPYERGKDYNHSTFCDLVISGIVGFAPMGDDAFAVRPLAPPTWDCFSLERVRYRGHDIDIRWHRGREGLAVAVNGKTVARSKTLSPLKVAKNKDGEWEGRCRD